MITPAATTNTVERTVNDESTGFQDVVRSYEATDPTLLVQSDAAIFPEWEVVDTKVSGDNTLTLYTNGRVFATVTATGDPVDAPYLSGRYWRALYDALP